MNVHDLINVQLQLSLFRNEPVSQYSERKLSCGQALCWIQKKTTSNTDFWIQNIPLQETWATLLPTYLGKVKFFFFLGAVSN